MSFRITMLHDARGTKVAIRAVYGNVGKEVLDYDSISVIESSATGEDFELAFSRAFADFNHKVSARIIRMHESAEKNEKQMSSLVDDVKTAIMLPSLYLTKMKGDTHA